MVTEVLLATAMAMSYGQVMGLAAIFYILSIGFAYGARNGSWLFILLLSVLTVASEVTFIIGMSKNDLFGPEVMQPLTTVMSLILIIPILAALAYFGERAESKAKARVIEEIKSW